MKKLFFAACVLLSASVSAVAANPYLPLWEHIPDGEPYVFDDPDQPGKQRVYIYGSHDSRITDYCGRELVVWSASVDSLNSWRYDGVIFENNCDANGKLLFADGRGDVLFAPDVAVATAPDGKKTYYLYPNNQEGGRNGMVAKSDRPDGPFKVINWSKNKTNETDGVLRFDPAVFVDDDGRVYGYWGFQKSYGAELDPATMATVRPGKKPVEDMVESVETDPESPFRFFEASSIRKIEDKYVFVYSRWTGDGEFGLPRTNYTLAYAYSDNPLGPWTYGGTLIDARGRQTQPDGTVIPTATPSGNTHGSLCQIKGKWYVFYHRQAGLNEFARQAMVAPVEVTVQKGKGGKVTITEGEYTSEGFETDGLDLFKTYPAAIACYFTGPKPAVHAWPEVQYYGPYFQATYYDGDPATAPSDLQLRSMPVVNNTSGSTLGYKYYNFAPLMGNPTMKIKLGLTPRGVDGNIDIYVGGPDTAHGGKKVGSIHVLKSEALQPTVKTALLKGLESFSGKQPVFLVFTSGTPDTSICDLHSITFSRH